MIDRCPTCGRGCEVVATRLAEVGFAEAWKEPELEAGGWITAIRFGTELVELVEIACPAGHRLLIPGLIDRPEPEPEQICPACLRLCLSPWHLTHHECPSVKPAAIDPAAKGEPIE